MSATSNMPRKNPTEAYRKGVRNIVESVKSQSEKFRDTARALGCDESEERFDAALKKIARSEAKPSPKGSERPRKTR